MEGVHQPELLVQRIRDLSRPLDPVETGLEPVFEEREGVRFVIFDVYGTLFISGSGDISLAQNENREEALVKSLSMLGIPPADGHPELHPRFVAAIRSAQEERRSVGVEWPEVEIREVWARFLKDLFKERVLSEMPEPEEVELLAVDFECRVNPIWPMPRLKEVLQEIRERGVRLGIVSNAQFFTPLLFKAFLDQWPHELGFDEDRCVWSFKMGEGKPSTNLYRTLASRLAHQSEEVLYVGNDMRNDVWPAREVGFRSCLYAGDQRSLRLREDDPRSESDPPSLIITALDQVLALLS